MKTPTSTHLSHLAVAVSIAINLLLLGALRAGFDVPSADTTSATRVVQLPSVTVVGKRLSTQDEVVALTAKPLPSPADVKL
jgi:hypothetical protein